MQGNVTGMHVAIRPDAIEDEIKEGALKGFQTATAIDSNLKARTEKGATTGVVIDVGPDAFKTTDPHWEPWCRIGDRVHFVRHTSKFIEDKDDLDSDGKPRQIFITLDSNIVWNEGEADERS